MASITRKRPAEEELFSSPKEAKISFPLQELTNEVLSIVFHYLKPSDQSNIAQTCSRFAVVTAATMQSGIYDEDKLLIEILQPLLNTLPENRQKELETIDKFSFPTVITERFQEIAAQKVAHQGSRQSLITAILQESLNLPLADAQDMATTLVSCHSKEDFYSTLFTLIRSKRAAPSSPTVYKEPAILDLLYLIAMQIKTARTSLDYVAREYLKIGLLEKVEHLANNVPSSLPLGWSLQVDIIQNLVFIYQQRGVLEKCSALCKSLPIEHRHHLHPQLSEVFCLYKEDGNIEGMLSVLNTVDDNAPSSFYQLEKFIQEISSLLGGDLTAVFTYVRRLESRNLQDCALSILSEAYQHRGDFSAALKTLQEITHSIYSRCSDSSSFIHYTCKSDALEALFTSWIENLQDHEEEVEAAFYAYASQSADFHKVKVSAYRLSPAMQAKAFLAIAYAFFNRGNIRQCFYALSEIPASQEKYNLLELLYQDSLRKKDFESAKQFLHQLSFCQFSIHKTTNESLMYAFIEICLKENAIAPAIKVIPSLGLWDLKAPVLNMIAHRVQESSLKDVEDITLQGIVDLYTDYSYPNASLQNSYTIAEKLPEPMKSRLLANIKTKREQNPTIII
jgi:hypothetical protein